MSSSEKPFRLRNFISLLITFSGLVMIVSGLVLYVVPEGRVAYWTNWKLFGLTKTAWGSVHTNLSFVFFIALFFHLYYNWRVLKAYLNRITSYNVCYTKLLRNKVAKAKRLFR